MSSTGDRAFTGFTPEAFEFLFELTGNNDRAWFQPRKADYERLLKQPLDSLCVALAERFRARGVPLLADPARSPFRIYRDVRFSKDRSPYKTNIGASFPWVVPRSTSGADPVVDEESRHGVGGYFHLSVESTFVGGGMWHPQPSRLAAFRSAVDQRPDSVKAVLEDPAIVRRFGPVMGDRLKRVPQGFPSDHPDAELLKLKDVGLGRDVSESEVFSRDLPDILTEDFVIALPVFRFLASLPA